MVGRYLAMELIDKYDNFTELKEEVNKFTSLLLSQKELPNINELKAITKHIIFFKNLISYSGKSHYKNCFIFDLLSTLHSLTNNSLRQFHYILRSLIENFARAMLLLTDEDETGVNELFRKLEGKFGDTDQKKELLNFIKGEYGKSCLFVHSNSKANINIQIYYSEIIVHDDFNQRELSSTINKILLILKKMAELIGYSYPHIVENSFYRRKQHLRFLIGDYLFEKLIIEIREKEK